MERGMHLKYSSNLLQIAKLFLRGANQLQLPLGPMGAVSTRDLFKVH